MTVLIKSRAMGTVTPLLRTAMLPAFLILAAASSRPTVSAAAPLTAGCAAPLTLTLRPGLTEPNNHVSLPAAPDIPPGPVVIQAPLYPGAVAGSLPMTQWSSRGGVIGYTRETLVGGMRRRADVSVDYLLVPHPYPAPLLARQPVGDGS